MDCLRYKPIGSKQSITSLGLAARLDADWLSFEQLQRYIEDHSRIALFEFKFDFADRRACAAVASADLSLVNDRLDPRGWVPTNYDRCSRDCRREDGTQLLIADQVAQPPASLRRIENRPFALDMVVPLAPLQSIQPSWIFDLDGLDELRALLAHPTR